MPPSCKISSVTSDQSQTLSRFHVLFELFNWKGTSQISHWIHFTVTFKQSQYVFIISFSSPINWKLLNASRASGPATVRNKATFCVPLYQAPTSRKQRRKCWIFSTFLPHFQREALFWWGLGFVWNTSLQEGNGDPLGCQLISRLQRSVVPMDKMGALESGL